MAKLTWTLLFFLKLARISVWALVLPALLFWIWMRWEDRLLPFSSVDPVFGTSITGQITLALCLVLAGLAGFSGIRMVLFSSDTSPRFFGDPADYPQSDLKLKSWAYQEYFQRYRVSFQKSWALLFFLLPFVWVWILVSPSSGNALGQLGLTGSIFAFFALVFWLFLTNQNKQGPLSFATWLGELPGFYGFTFPKSATRWLSLPPGRVEPTPSAFPLETDVPIRSWRRLNPAFRGIWPILGVLIFTGNAILILFEDEYGSILLLELNRFALVLALGWWVLLTLQFVNQLVWFPIGLCVLIAGVGVIFSLESNPQAAPRPARLGEVRVFWPSASGIGVVSALQSPDTLNMEFVPPQERFSMAYRTWTGSLLEQWWLLPGSDHPVPVRLRITGQAGPWFFFRDSESPGTAWGFLTPIVRPNPANQKPAENGRISNRVLTGPGIRLGYSPTEKGDFIHPGNSPGLRLHRKGFKPLFIPFPTVESQDLFESRNPGSIWEKEGRSAARTGYPLFLPPTPVPPNPPRQIITKDTATLKEGVAKSKSNTLSPLPSRISPATHPHLYYYSKTQKKWRLKAEADFDIRKIRPLKSKSKRKVKRG